ncbi:MAG: type II toxin-antitoxin system HicA family toxin [Methylococcaceae bacterium]|nr:type II toxin-antitoxin system HicA family toxin [Methylococcaceae bacterium]MDP3905559.1 type II toxin-antitoxin system HicA family toxin [Methylococcaceae bacterium]
MQKIIHGRSDANVLFSELRQLLLRLDFEERIRGDHHIFSKPDVAEILNIQPIGSMAKAYQVKQIRQIIVRYRLGLDDD